MIGGWRRRLVGRGSRTTPGDTNVKDDAVHCVILVCETRRAAGPACVSIPGIEPANNVEPLIDHIQTTVKDMSLAVPFYERLLPLLGFDGIKYEIVSYPKKEA